MPRGNTATIDFQSLRIQWGEHVPISHLCQNFSISRDQMTRLKFVLGLPPRHDRKLRWKPKRSETRDPTPREIAQACREIQARWDERTREERAVTKTQHVTLRFVATPDEADHIIRDHNRE